MTRSDEGCEGNNWKQVRKHIHSGDYHAPAEVDFQQCLKFFLTSAGNTFHKAVLPGIKFKHLDVVDGLCRHLHSSVLAAHEDFFLLILPDSDR